MQSYRLVIESDGTVRIPNGQPGRIVTVLVEESVQAIPERAIPVSSMTPAERERLKVEFLQRGKRIRSRLSDQLSIDDSELYGDDGLPT